MFHVVLFQPEIPPNTGNIIRLCANTGAALHLIEPLGFELDEPRLRRAGLDYHEWAQVNRWSDLSAFFEGATPRRTLAFSSKATRSYATIRYEPGDAFLFGPETRGLPPEVLQHVDSLHQLRLPMRPHNRSLNLSNAVAVVCFEAWRQHDFIGANAI
jgi:tRNA (cytidine/uridine-2'-O-)-methyltransferase